MATKYTFEPVIADVEQIARVWTDNPTFSMGDLTLASLQSKITGARQTHDRMKSLRTELTALTNDLNEKTAELAGISSRARSGFRAFYGPDSTQYEQAGGTRASERKRPSSKKKTAPAT